MLDSPKGVRFVPKPLCETCGRPPEWGHHEGCAPPAAAPRYWTVDKEARKAFGQLVLILLGLVVAAGVWLAIDGLPGALHHYERQQECMKWQPPVETMGEWFRQQAECKKATK
jgi:hypothetical protein